MTGVARPAKYDPEDILDAARDLVLTQGPRGITLEGICRSSGAPVGSVYHRFGSVDQLLCRVWLRAVRRYQSVILSALDERESVDIPQLSLGVYDFCLRQPGEARLLASIDPADLPRRKLGRRLRREIDAANEPLSDERARRVTAEKKIPFEVLELALSDLPLAFARRHMSGDAPPENRRRLHAAVAALLGA